MEIQFWYCDFYSNYTNIKETIQKIDNTILFKNISTDKIDPTKLNFLVFLLETEWENSDADKIKGFSKNIKTSNTNSNEFINLLIELQHKNFYFLMDNTGEAVLWLDEKYLNFINKLNRNKIDSNRLIIANNDSSDIGINKRNKYNPIHNLAKYGSFILNTCFFPKFFLSTYNHMSGYIEDITIKTVIKPDKTFLCLNRRMNFKKYQIIEELFNKGLLRDTRFTWVHNAVPTNRINKKLLSELNINVDNFKSIQLEDDVMYGSQLSYLDEFLYTINPNWYYKSKVNIITETMLYKNSIHLTEKTWKAIYLGVPFVIYAPSKHYLKTLRDMGFKTFNSVINEDYDEMDGDGKIKKIIDSALELSNIYDSKEVLEICKFNQELYFNLEYRKKIYKETFLDKLYDIKTTFVSKTLI
jgi:hypothetical protein